MSALVCQVTEHCEFDRAEVGFNSFLPGPRLQGVLRLRSPFLRDLQRHDVLQSGEVLCGSQVIALPFPVFGQLEQPFPFPFHIIPMASHGLSMHFPCTSHALPFSIIFPYCLGFLLEGPHGSAGPQEAFEGIGSWIWQTIITFFFLGGVADYYYFFFFLWGGGGPYDYYYFYSFLVLSGIATNLVYGSFFVHWN